MTDHPMEFTTPTPILMKIGIQTQFCEKITMVPIKIFFDNRFPPCTPLKFDPPFQPPTFGRPINPKLIEINLTCYIFLKTEKHKL